MVLLNVFVLNQLSCLHGKAELLVEEEDDGTDTVPCNLDHMEGFVGSKEHAHVECSPGAEGRLGSPGVVCLLLAFHSNTSETGGRL